MLCSSFLWLLQSVVKISLKQRDLEWHQQTKDFSEEGCWWCWWIFFPLTCLSSVPRRAALQFPRSCLEHPLPWWHFQSWSSARLGRGTQLSPAQAQDTPCTEHCKQHSGEKHIADSSKQGTWGCAKIFLGLRKKTVCSIYKWCQF